MGSQRLVFDGDIELIDDGSAGDGYWFEALEGAQFGKAVPIEVVLTSLLRDGAIVSKTGDDNRSMSFPIRVCGVDPIALAKGEERLSRALGKRTTLEWTPPVSPGKTTVFDVMTSDLDVPPFDDLAELRNQRTYTLLLTCLPFGRSATKVSDSAGSPPSSGGTVVDSCQSTTGWSAVSDPSTTTPVISVDTSTFYEGTGSIKITAGVYNGNASPGPMTLARNTDTHTVSIATGSGGYLSVAIRLDWAGFTGYPSTVQIFQRVNGALPTEVSVSGTEALTGGFVRYSWPVDAGVTVTELQFKVSQYYSAVNQPKPSVHYDAITLSTAATTDHQIIKHLEVLGSARAPGSLHIAAPSTSVALGQVLAMTVADEDVMAGFVPDARRWTTSGTTTTDTSALHGSYFTITSAYSGSPTFDVPVTILAPGPYTVVALAYPNTTLSLSVQAQLKIGSTLTGPTSESSASLPSPASTWQMFSLGTVYLPPVPMQNADSTATVRLRFAGSGRLADAFIIPEAADFSIVDCGSGSVGAAGASSNLWIDSPDPLQPQGGWWRGADGSRGSAISAWPDAKKPGQHTFKPGGLTGCVVSTGASGPTLTLEYYPACLTNSAH